jgi:hypothetical protein
MTTLVWLGLILAVIVLALVYVTWDIRTTFTKAYRYSYVDGYRAGRRAEDAAWADFLAEAGDRRRQLEQALQADGAVDRLRHLIDAYTPESEQALRVVA